ncbi:unnamed protein product, partial [Effrenium voratum]
MDEESDKWELLQARRRRKQQQSARDALQREEERKLVQEYLAYLQQKKFQQQQQRQQLLCRVRAKPQTAEKAEKAGPGPRRRSRRPRSRSCRPCGRSRGCGFRGRGKRRKSCRECYFSTCRRRIPKTHLPKALYRLKTNSCRRTPLRRRVAFPEAEAEFPPNTNCGVEFSKPRSIEELRIRVPRSRVPSRTRENVATLYGKFKGPLMLKYLKELEASDKVTAWRLNEILSLPNEAECESERTDRDKADWIDVGGPVSRQGAWTPCAVDVAVSNANCAARFSSLCQDAKTIESCCAEQVLAQVTAEIDMCKAPPPTNKCDGLYGAEGLQCAWEEDAKSCVEQSCKGCGGEQCQLCRADAQRIAGCCDDHYHSVDPPQICKDSKEEAVTSCMDSKCRGCGGEQCQLCREDAKSECCTGAMRTPSCESK